MREVIVRIYEGDPLPDGLTFKRLIGAYAEPWGSGTGSRLRYAILCDKPLMAAGAAPTTPASTPKPRPHMKGKRACDE